MRSLVYLGLGLFLSIPCFSEQANNLLNSDPCFHTLLNLENFVTYLKNQPNHLLKKVPSSKCINKNISSFSDCFDIEIELDLGKTPFDDSRLFMAPIEAISHEKDLQKNCVDRTDQSVKFEVDEFKSCTSHVAGFNSGNDVSHALGENGTIRIRYSNQIARFGLTLIETTPSGFTTPQNFILRMADFSDFKTYIMPCFINHLRRVIRQSKSRETSIDDIL